MLVVNCFNRLTYCKRYLFQGSSFSEAVNSVSKRIILHRALGRAVVPREIRRALYRARLHQNEESEKFNHQIVLRLVAARLVLSELDALKFCVEVCPFSIIKRYSFV